jgi:uncharacterized protein (DUF4213/DUF364 family)
VKIIDALISTLTNDVPVKDVRLGAFQTAVLTLNCGLASTPHNPGPHPAGMPVNEAGLFLEKGTQFLVNMAKSSSPMESAIGMAAINSLIDINEQRCVESNAAELLARKGKDRRIALVGHFPFVHYLRKIAKELWIIERNPRAGDFIEIEAEKLIPQADVVGITGTAFTNHTIEHLLELCRPDAYVVMLGGTTPLSPVLFDYGVDALSGAVVVNPELVLRYVSQGATFRQIKGIRLVTMEK